MTDLVILIDTSYFVFHRYYATLRWYSNCEPEKSQCVSVDDAEFVSAFFRHFREDLRKLRKKHVYLTDIWMVLDCHRADIWRRGLYPEYKLTRTHSATFDGRIFQLVYDWIEREGATLMLKTVSHPCLEADDICYILYKNLEYNRLVIIANDNDYQQICSSNVEVINKEGKCISERGCGDAAKDLLRKVLMGDKSDNIPPVCKGLGPKTADKLIAMSDNERLQWITQKGGLERFELNTKLVDMRHIPHEYQDEVCDVLKLKK